MKRWLRIAFQIVSLLLFALMIWWAGADAATAVLQGDRQLLLIALGLYGIAGVASATRLRVVAKSIHHANPASWRQFYRLNWVARSLGLVLPRTLSAIGGKSVGLRSYGVPIKRSLWIVLVDNLFDVGLLALICIPAFMFFRGTLTEIQFVTAVILILFLAGAFIWWGTSDRWLQRLTRWVKSIPFLSQKIDLEEGQTVISLPQGKDAIVALAWTIVLNLVLVFGFYFMARAVDISVHWTLFLAAYPFVQLSLIAAVTPGGLGIFDLGWLGLLALGGVSEGDALTFVVAQRAYVAIFVLIWTGFSILLGFTEKQSTSISEMEHRQS